MKKPLLFIVVILLILNLYGCGSNNNSQLGGQENPTATTGLFIAYIEDGKYQEAETLLTDDAASMYNEDRLKEFHDFFTKQDGVMTNDIDEAEITGDTATVPIYWTDAIDTKNYKVNLVKESDGWKISSVSEQ